MGALLEGEKVIGGHVAASSMPRMKLPSIADFSACDAKLNHCQHCIFGEK
jgi:hypothetical protein